MTDDVIRYSRDISHRTTRFSSEFMRRVSTQTSASMFYRDLCWDLALELVECAIDGTDRFEKTRSGNLNRRAASIRYHLPAGDMFLGRLGEEILHKRLSGNYCSLPGRHLFSIIAHSWRSITKGEFKKVQRTSKEKIKIESRLPSWISQSVNFRSTQFSTVDIQFIYRTLIPTAWDIATTPTKVVTDL